MQYFINVQVSVKFRAFRYTFSHVKKQWQLVFSTDNLSLNVISKDWVEVTHPPQFNDRGIMVKFWKATP